MLIGCFTVWVGSDEYAQGGYPHMIRADQMENMANGLMWILDKTGDGLPGWESDGNGIGIGRSGADFYRHGNGQSWQDR